MSIPIARHSLSALEQLSFEPRDANLEKEGEISCTCSTSHASQFVNVFSTSRIVPFGDGQRGIPISRGIPRRGIKVAVFAFATRRLRDNRDFRVRGRAHFARNSEKSVVYSQPCWPPTTPLYHSILHPIISTRL